MSIPTVLSRAYFNHSIRYYDKSNQQMVDFSIGRDKGYVLLLGRDYLTIYHLENEAHKSWVPVTNLSSVEAYDYDTKAELAQAEDAPVRAKKAA